MTTQELQELDAWIAEHVFKLKKNIRPIASHIPVVCYTNNPFFADGQHTLATLSEYCQPREYTTDRAAAMEVLEKCLADESTIIIEIHNGKFSVVIGKATRVVFEADTLPLAICLFAKNLFGGGQ